MPACCCHASNRDLALRNGGVGHQRLTGQHIVAGHAACAISQSCAGYRHGAVAYVGTGKLTCRVGIRQRFPSNACSNTAAAQGRYCRTVVLPACCCHASNRDLALRDVGRRYPTRQRVVDCGAARQD